MILPTGWIIAIVVSVGMMAITAFSVLLVTVVCYKLKRSYLLPSI